MLGELNSERFQDKAPAQVHATLLEEGTYLCSTRTMYRILADNEQVRERRAQARHPVYARPELIATAPNQVWSWDITKLKTFEKFVCLNLYVMLDIFSRYVVGWMVAEKDNATLAERFLRETIKTHSVDPSKLTSHSDRGASMRALTVAQLLAQLNVTQSFSRPRVSNDNPFSESQFKTTKYDCDFPEKFGGIDDALKFCREYFPGYNHEHHHSGITYLTPATVHFGRVEEVLATRDATLMAAYEQHPERFSKPPRSPRPPSVVYINAPRTGETGGPEKPVGEQRALQGARPRRRPERRRSDQQRVRSRSGGATLKSSGRCLTLVDTYRTKVGLPCTNGTRCRQLCTDCETSIPATSISSRMHDANPRSQSAGWSINWKWPLVALTAPPHWPVAFAHVLDSSETRADIPFDPTTDNSRGY